MSADTAPILPAILAKAALHALDLVQKTAGACFVIHEPRVEEVAGHAVRTSVAAGSC